MNIKDTVLQTVRDIATEKQGMEDAKVKVIVREADGTYKEECYYDYNHKKRK